MAKFDGPVEFQLNEYGRTFSLQGRLTVVYQCSHIIVAFNGLSPLQNLNSQMSHVMSGVNGPSLPNFYML